MSDSDPDLVALSEEGFISRWSRLKQADNADPPDELQALEAPVDAEAVEDVDLPDDSDMPPVESLDEDSDYSAFMSPKVSEGLRTLALRKLFHGEMFNIRDGLDDYDDDFTSFTKLGDIVTAEMRYQLERMKEAMGSDDMEQGELEDDPAEAALQADAAEMMPADENLIKQDDQNDQDIEDDLSDENK